MDFNDPTEFSSLRQLSEIQAGVTECEVFSNRFASFEAMSCFVTLGSWKTSGEVHISHLRTLIH